jgi:Fe-S oxidoreductase
MQNGKLLESASSIRVGIEDKFYYTISSECVMCGECVSNCPVHAVKEQEGVFEIDTAQCIDCGTCSSVCPTGAAQRIPYKRSSIAIESIDEDKCYFNPGCALNLYKKDVADAMLNMLKEHFENIKLHSICCRHDPKLPTGSTIINNCAGCDRRFRSLYEGINTISFWEVIDSIAGLKLPDYSGTKMSVHDSCGYRHKPQVHNAIRSLLRKMKIEVVEAEFHGTESICCGDNFYGYVPNEDVQERIKSRAEQFPCKDVVVYCIGCERAMGEAGKTPHYLPDLLFGKESEQKYDLLDEYHHKLETYIKAH